MRKWGIIAGAALLAGCAANSREVVDRLGAKYVGQNVDVLVTEWGPPASTFKMSKGETSYMWQLSSETQINTYRGSGTAETSSCKVNVIAEPSGIISKITTQDPPSSANGLIGAYVIGESLCARRLGMQRST